MSYNKAEMKFIHSHERFKTIFKVQKRISLSEFKIIIMIKNTHYFFMILSDFMIQHHHLLMKHNFPNRCVVRYISKL